MIRSKKLTPTKKLFVEAVEAQLGFLTSKLALLTILLYITLINMMPLIREIVRHALDTSYLTIEAEEQLRQLLTTKYALEDFNAFMILQQATMIGQVKQESREQLQSARK